MNHAYRSAYQHIVGMRLAEMKLAREMVEPHLPRLRSVRSARIARLLAGGAGAFAALVMVFLACAGDDAAPTYALVGGGVAVIGTYVLARVVLAIAGSFRRTALPVPALTGELGTDLARIDASDPLRAVERRLGSLEAWSTALPLAAISLLMPLTLHYAFVSMSGPGSPESFAQWIRMSLVIVGHAHLALVALAIAFARKMRRSTSEDLAKMSVHREWLKAWGITIGVAAVPGVVLIGIPPILTAITGLAFIPFMFALMRRRVMNERAALELAEVAVHVRIAPGAAPALSALEETAWCEVALPDHDRVDATSARASAARVSSPGSSGASPRSRRADRG